MISHPPALPLRVVVAGLMAMFLGGGGARAGGVLTLAQAQDPGGWDPPARFYAAWGSVAHNVFDGLVARDGAMTLRPGLAVGWDVLEDGRRLRFRLRAGAVFHDGSPVTAEAVRASFARLLAAKGPQQAEYAAIAAVEVVDPLTVELRLGRADAAMLTKLAGYGAVVTAPGLGESGPIGTGPFRLAAYRPGESVTLEAFGAHWGGAPKLSGVTYRFMPAGEAQVAALLSGQVDVVVNLPVSMAGTVARAAGLRLESVAGPGVTALRFNTAQGAAQSVTVRRAMVMAVDREAIIRQLLHGHGRVVAGMQTALSFGHDPALKPLGFDPSGARKLLAEAKLPAGTVVSIDYPAGDAGFRDVAQAVAGYLGAVGLKAVVRAQETGAYEAEMVPQGRTGEMFQLAWAGWTMDYGVTAEALYRSGARWNPADRLTGLDALLDAQAGLSEPAARARKLQEIGRMVAENVLEMPLYALNTLYGVSRRVQGFAPPADGRLRLERVGLE